MKALPLLVDVSVPKAIIRGSINPAFVEMLSEFVEVHFQSLPSGLAPDLYVIEFGKDSTLDAEYGFCLRRRKAPILVILHSDFYTKYPNAFNFPFGGTLGYLLTVSVPCLLEEAVRSICRNEFFCDPAITSIKTRTMR